MSFAHIESQEAALEGLQRALQSRRLHHAYLFFGPDGVGKGLAARAFAQALLCTQPTAEALACEQCASCARVREGQHPDLHSLERQPRADGAGLEVMIKIDQVRDLQKSLQFKAFEGGRRVILLFEPESMNAATANALLKTLEEPGPGTHFVLVCHAVHRLLPTILSRCQKVRFKPLPRPLVGRILAERLSLDLASADLLAGLAQGSVGQALNLAESTLLERRVALMGEIDAPAGPAQLPERLELAEQLASDRAQLPVFFLMLRTWLRDQLLLGQGLSEQRLVHRDQIDLLRQRQQGRSMEQLAQMIERINEVEEAIFMGNANARMQMEPLFLALARLGTPPAQARAVSTASGSGGVAQGEGAQRAKLSRLSAALEE